MVKAIASLFPKLQHKYNYVKKKVAAYSFERATRQATPAKNKLHARITTSLNSEFSVGKAIRDSQISNHGRTKAYCLRGCYTWLFTFTFYIMSDIYSYNS